MSKHKHPVPATPVASLTRHQLIDLCADLKLPASAVAPTKAALTTLGNAGVAFVQRTDQGSLAPLKADYSRWVAPA